ncbi:retrovirus-related pol polyprotein from transposon TNT 1-94 [Tanacetum coccineum]
MDKLESENVSLEFQVQSLIKDRENVKSEYQKLFDSIKKTRTQTQGEIIELIEHANQKSYAYAEVHAQNQDLLITISELKAKLNHVEKGLKAAFSVIRSSNRDSSFKNSVLTNTKNSLEKVEVSIRKNKMTYVASKNVFSKKKIVTDANVKNALKAKDVLRALFTTPRITKSMCEDTTPVVSKTRFSVMTIQSKSLDTTPVVFTTKIDAVTTLSAKNKIVDSGCSKHMTGDRLLLENFIEKFIGTVRFGNDHFATITGYGDYIQGNITVCHVYYVEGIGHNLFSVGQFCDGDLEVAFRSKTCYVRNLEGDDLLTGARESNLYTISISDMAASLLVCLMSKATSTKSWLWHRRLREKSMKSSHLPKVVPSNHSKLELLHMDLCGPIQVASINRKKYILVIVDDYSRITWVYFLHTKDETPEIIKNFIARVQLNYNAKVYKIQTHNGTELNNATLKAHYEKLGIMKQFLIARMPQQNGVAEAVSIACFTQNQSIIHIGYNKTPYELLHGRKPNVEYFHVFGSLCYPTNEQDDLGKMKPKADIGSGYHQKDRKPSQNDKTEHGMEKTIQSCRILRIRFYTAINCVQYIWRVVRHRDLEGSMDHTLMTKDIHNAYLVVTCIRPRHLPIMCQVLKVPPSPDFVPERVFPESCHLRMRGDDGDDEDELSDDDKDEDVDIKGDEEEEEHPAPADSTAVTLPAVEHASFAEETEPFETDESTTTPPPHPAYRVTARISIRDELPTPFWSDIEVARLLAIPTPPPSPLSPCHYDPAESRGPIYFPFTTATYHTLPHQSRYTTVRYRTIRDTPLIPHTLPTSSSSLLLPSTDHEADRPEVCLPLWKRLCFAFGPSYEVGESSYDAAARLNGGLRADYGFVSTMDRAIMRDLERDVGYVITDTWDEMLVDMSGALTTDNTELGRWMTDFPNPPSRQQVMALRTQVVAHQAVIIELQAANRRRQAAISELLAADPKKQDQFIEALRSLKRLQTQMTEFERQ